MVLGPILRGECISLEPIRHQDLETFRRWLADTQVTRYLLARFVPSTKAEEEWYERISTSQDSVHWSLMQGEQAIGNTAIRIDWVNRQGHTGLFIGERDHWGKGYASEAVALRTAYAFEELGLERLESESLTDNVAMHRALAKSGYQRIGTKRHFVFRGGRWHDAHIFEVLREDWLADHA